MSGFNGLRVLSFESRRAKEIARLIASQGGTPIVAPSTREVPEKPQEDELRLIRGILDREFDLLILMTGVGARALADAAETVVSKPEFLSALAQTRVVVRGMKPAAVMREFNVPVWLNAPEPNTWREVIQVLDGVAGTHPLQGLRVGVQEHGEPSEEMYTALRERGASVFAARVYRWELPEDVGPLKNAVRSLAEGNIDVVMFTSSVQLSHALKVAGELNLEPTFLAALDRVLVASIGPVTSAALRQKGIAVDLEPSHPKMGFLVNETAARSAEMLRMKSSKPSTKTQGGH